MVQLVPNCAIIPIRVFFFLDDFFYCAEVNLTFKAGAALHCLSKLQPFNMTWL